MSTGTPWNPAQYEQFRNERSRPFFDLLGMVRSAQIARAVDLGCGTGEWTRILHQHTGAEETIGLDSSPEMLARAESFTEPGLSSALGSIEDFAAGTAPGSVDLLFSNAALHWCPDHESLLPRLLRTIACGGQFAMQVPDNQSHPAYAASVELSREEPFRSWLGGWVHRSPVQAPEWYAALLHREGFTEIEATLRVYVHLLPEPYAVLEWVKGTWFTAWQSRLTADQYAEFLAAYRERLRTALPEERPYCFTFRRVLVVAKRGWDGTAAAIPVDATQEPAGG